MNKLGLVAAVVVVGAVAAAPFVSGMMIEQRIKAYQLPASVPVGTVWHLDSYQRGYLHSTALSTLSFSSPSLAEPMRIQIKQDIDQVPGLDGRLATIRTTWLPTPEVKAELAKVLGDKEPVAFDTAVLLTGATHTTGTIAAFSMPQAQFSGGTIRLDTAKGGAFDFLMTVDSLSAQDPQDPQPTVLKGMKIDGKGVMAPDGVAWNSDFKMSIDSLAAEQGHVDGVMISGNSVLVGEALNTGVGIDIKSLDFPDLPAAAKGIHDVAIHYRLDGLDKTALTAITEQLRAAQKTEGSDPEQIKQAITMAFMTQLPALLNRGVSFQINPFGFTTHAGKVALNLSVTMPAGHGSEALSNPMGLIEVLTIKGDYTAPQALMSEALGETGEASPAESQINQLIQAGYINANQGILTTNFAFEHGKLSINGKPADDMLGALGALAQ